jgi:uncharacterized protein (DUF58 family)
MKKIYILKKLKNTLMAFLLKDKHDGSELVLKHNTIYVLPSKMGCGFLIIAILNFILGINYQNNLILAMAYLMFVVLVLAILVGYSNMNGLTIQFKSAHSHYSPISPQLDFVINPKKDCQSLQFIYSQQTILTQEIIKKRTCLTVSLPHAERGRYAIKKFKILSQYPFGLVSVWSYMNLKHTVFVYPEQLPPKANSMNAINSGSEKGNVKRRNGTDEFEFLAIHQQGMSLQRVSWKHYAKTQQLMIKEFEDLSAEQRTFDFANLMGTTESRLSQLSYLVTQANVKGQAYSLKLDGKMFTYNKGTEHLTTCLEALSCYGDTIEDTE